jgi:hypothetical protein
MKVGLLLFAFFLSQSCTLTRSGPAGVTVSNENLILCYNRDTGRMSLSKTDRGEVLCNGALILCLEDGELSSEKARPEKAGEENKPALRLTFEQGPKALFHLDGDRILISITGRAERVKLHFHCEADQDAFPVFLKNQEKEDGHVLVTSLGHAHVPQAESLFLPGLDMAVSAETKGTVEWRFDSAWRLEVDGPAKAETITLTVFEDYFKDDLGITYYRPFEKRGYWKTAPVVAMTWYGVCGMKQPQDLDILKPEIDWVAENLLPYAGQIVFQLDDNYDYSDTGKMRALSDYIRGKGLVPGIWFTPFGIAPEEAYHEYPKGFLHDPDGKPLHSFAGVNWKWKGQRGQSAGVIDVTDEKAVEQWFAPYWRRASETWNFDFFKIDGQPTAVKAYQRADSEQGVERYRKGLAKGREIVGPDKFINGCWGMAIEGAGIFNGSRTGGDTGYHGHAVNVIISRNFLNNTVWWCDPDAAAVLYDKPKEVVRLNAQARALTGQQFLTDDMWTQVHPENLKVWQKSFPMLNIRPANLYPINETWSKYDLFDLRVAKPWGTFDVVGLFNYQKRSASKRIDLNRLPLEAREVHVFDFWSSTYLGRFTSNATIDIELKPLEGRLFSLVPAKRDRPALVSTSRHVSQGGLELKDLVLERRKTGWKVSGTSTHLVAEDPYELVFATGRYQIMNAKVEGGEVTVNNEPGLGRVRILPKDHGSVDWNVEFKVGPGPGMECSPLACVLRPGAAALTTITNLGEKSMLWEGIPSDPRIRLTPMGGKLKPWPGQDIIHLSVDRFALAPGDPFLGRVDFCLEKSGELLYSMPVRVMAPPPENLALKAIASASSQWDKTEDFHPRRINDGQTETRWNSAKGDESGSWVRLIWPHPVRFNRVVLDECLDFGPRIQAWRLHAHGKEPYIIARSEGAGPQHVVHLQNPCTTDTLTLFIEKASVTPTLWEIEVYDWKARPKNPLER